MRFDTKVPLPLKKTQTWFASIITRPIDEESRMNPISPSGQPMEEEAYDFIVPSPTLRPAQRIQIYNQQYWWRLLNSLHETYPLVVRLFGYHDFNQTIGIPYLSQCPPNHWSLNQLGDRLPQWIEDHYHDQDKNLIKDAVEIDYAYNRAFFAAKHAPIDMASLPVKGDVSCLLTEKLCLQPYVYLFELQYDLLKLRDEMLKEEPEFWIDNDFPLLLREKKKYHFVIFRNHYHNIVWNDLSEEAYRVLSLFKKGEMIENVCQWLEKQEDSFFETVSEKLHFWFQEWTMRHWLYPYNLKKNPIV